MSQALSSTFANRRVATRSRSGPFRYNVRLTNESRPIQVGAARARRANGRLTVNVCPRV